MARPKNANSKRQRAFKRLSQMTHLKREFAIEKLKTEFEIGDSYAATLYASYRTLRKEAGNMPQVFSVQDSRDGKACDPYIRVQNVLRPSQTDCLTPVAAKKAYAKSLTSRLAIAKKL